MDLYVFCFFSFSKKFVSPAKFSSFITPSLSASPSPPHHYQSVPLHTTPQRLLLPFHHFLPHQSRPTLLPTSVSSTPFHLFSSTPSLPPSRNSCHHPQPPPLPTSISSTPFHLLQILHSISSSPPSICYSKGGSLRTKERKQKKNLYSLLLTSVKWVRGG